MVGVVPGLQQSPSQFLSQFTMSHSYNLRPRNPYTGRVDYSVSAGVAANPPRFPSPPKIRRITRSHPPSPPSPHVMTPGYKYLLGDSYVVLIVNRRTLPHSYAFLELKRGSVTWSSFRDTQRLWGSVEKWRDAFPQFASEPLQWVPKGQPPQIIGLPVADLSRGPPFTILRLFGAPTASMEVTEVAVAPVEVTEVAVAPAEVTEVAVANVASVSQVCLIEDDEDDEDEDDEAF